MTLLLDRRRLGIALRDDQAAQRSAIFAGHLLPHGLALVIAEGNRATGLRLREEDTPAVFRHLHVAELRPASCIHADGRAQVNVARLETIGAHVPPPLQEARL